MLVHARVANLTKGVRSAELGGAKDADDVLTTMRRYTFDARSLSRVFAPKIDSISLGLIFVLLRVSNPNYSFFLKK